MGRRRGIEGLGAICQAMFRQAEQLRGERLGRFFRRARHKGIFGAALCLAGLPIMIEILIAGGAHGAYLLMLMIERLENAPSLSRGHARGNVGAGLCFDERGKDGQRGRGFDGQIGRERHAFGSGERDAQTDKGAGPGGGQEAVNIMQCDIRFFDQARD